MTRFSWIIVLVVAVTVVAATLTPDEELREVLLKANYDMTIYRASQPFVIGLFKGSSCGGNGSLKPNTPYKTCWDYRGVNKMTPSRCEK